LESRKAIGDLVNFIPVVGSVKALIESINQCHTAPLKGEKCDVGALIFAGVGVALDIIPGVGLAAKGLKAIGPLFKLGVGLEKAAVKAGVAFSRIASPISTFIRNQEEKALAFGARTMEGMFEWVKGFAEPGWKWITQCALNCKNMPDGIFAN
jgi:hypothetical protein